MYLYIQNNKNEALSRSKSKNCVGRKLFYRRNNYQKYFEKKTNLLKFILTCMFINTIENFQNDYQVLQLKPSLKSESMK